MKISHIGLLFGIIGLGGAIPTFAATASVCDAVSGNLVQNCGFETGDFTDWTVTGTVSSNFDVFTNFPDSGNDDARFGDTTLDYIDQSFSTVAGDTYSVSFYVDATVPGNVVSPNGQFVAEWDGTNILSMTGSTYPGSCSGPDSAGYDLCSFTETATSTSSDIKFGGATADAYYHLDDVIVTQNTSAVPEPSSISFALAGLFGALVVGRRYMEKRSKA
jgi:hypothetical protein